MQKVYIQIVDPIHGTNINACHEYPDEYNQSIEATLKQYGLPIDGKNFGCISDSESDLPGMPNYYMSQGLVEGTSKLVNIIVVHEV